MKNNGYMSVNVCIKDYVDNLQYEYSFLKEVDSIIIRRILKYRTYKCNNCSNNIDRDLNASINIMFKGLKLHMKKIIC